MIQGITKTCVLTGTKHMDVRVTVTEQYDIESNQSDIQVGLEVANAAYAGHTYYLNGLLQVDGETLVSMSATAGSHHVHVGQKNTYYPISGAPWSLTGILHENDGSKILTISLEAQGVEANGRGANGWRVSGSVDVELTRIPRASTPGATDANIGAVSLIAIHKKHNTYIHSLAYRFGPYQGYLTPAGARTEQEMRFPNTQVPFRLPEDFFYAIPDAKSGKCLLTCRTYQGTEPVGQPETAEFTATASEADCKPILAAQVQDSNPVTLALTGDANTLIRYCSHGRCALTAYGRKGATILQRTVAGQSVGEEGCTLENVEVSEIPVSVTDSRGYRTELTLQPALIPYRKLTCQASARRTDPVSGNATLTLSGVFYPDSLGKTDNSLTLRCRVGDGPWQNVTYQLTEEGYAAETLLTDLDYTRAHTIEVEAADKLMTVQKSVQLGKGLPVFDWGERDFTFHVPVRFLGGLPDYVETDGVIQWLRPPMEPGMEYRILEQHRGKPVYTALIDCGFFPGNTVLEIPHGMAVDQILRCQGYGEHYGCVLPYFDTSSTTQVAAEVTANRGSILVRTTTGAWTGYRCYTQIWYTK